MEIILMLSGFSILVSIFVFFVFVGGIPAIMIFKKVDNEKIASVFGVAVAILVCQNTFNSYLNSMDDMKPAGIVAMLIFFVIFVIPFVAYGFPDYTFPGRALLAGGVVSSALGFLNISILNFDMSKFFSNEIVLYISCAWTVWNVIAL